ncbi:unnamed protein product [Musa hybrid cultivar]
MGTTKSLVNRGFLERLGLRVGTLNAIKSRFQVQHGTRPLFVPRASSCRPLSRSSSPCSLRPHSFSFLPVSSVSHCFARALFIVRSSLAPLSIRRIPSPSVAARGG